MEQGDDKTNLSDCRKFATAGKHEQEKKKGADKR